MTGAAGVAVQRLADDVLTPTGLHVAPGSHEEPVRRVLERGLPLSDDGVRRALEGEAVVLGPATMVVRWVDSCGRAARRRSCRSVAGASRGSWCSSRSIPADRSRPTRQHVRCCSPRSDVANCSYLRHSGSSTLRVVRRLLLVAVLLAVVPAAASAATAPPVATTTAPVTTTPAARRRRPPRPPRCPDGVIAPGVTIGGVAVGGMTTSQGARRDR